MVMLVVCKCGGRQFARKAITSTHFLTQPHGQWTELSYPIGGTPLYCIYVCCTMLCYAMLCYAMLCYAMLCYTMLCYAILCYAMLYYTATIIIIPIIIRLILILYQTTNRMVHRHPPGVLQ